MPPRFTLCITNSAIPSAGASHTHRELIVMDSNMAETADANAMAIAGLIASELDLAFHGPRNNERLEVLIDNYYQNSLNFGSSLNVNNPLFFHNFSVYLNSLGMEHSTMKEAVQPMDDAFSKRLFWLAFFKKALSVFSNTAASFCVAAVIYKLNDVPKNVDAAAAAAAASVLIPALAKWGHSVLMKRESTVNKHKKVTTLLIRGAEKGTKLLGVLGRIYEATADAGEKATAYMTSVEELLRKVEDYSVEMRKIKKDVVESIKEHLG